MSKKVGIEQLRSHDDSARPYKWDVAMTIPGASNTSLLEMRCTTAGQPQPNYSPIDVLIRGFTKKEAGAVEWNEISFTVIEVASYSILKDLWAWGQSQFNNKTGVQKNKSGGYEASMKLMLLDLQDNVKVTWVLEGCVCSSMTPPDMSSEKSGTVELSFSIGYDYADLK